MARALRLVPAALAAAVLGSVSRPALAEAPNARATPVYVLSIWTDDADDQADALTQALRSRVRQTTAWSLLETTQSFETLAIALKCPPKPDPSCLQRIGDQLRADHYVWGSMSKKRSGGEVTAELHLWSRGRQPAEASESFSENLKDASDESIRAIAARLFAKLGGTAAGTLVVRAGRGSGAVLVDGVEKGSLEGGSARLEVPPGAHVVSVRIPGLEAPDQSTEVASGADQEVSFALAPASRRGPAQEGERSAPFPVTKVLGWSAIVAGTGFLVAGGIEGLNWLSDSNTSSTDRSQVPRTVTDVCNDPASAAQDACNKSNDAKSVSTRGWIFAGAGAVLVGTGIVLVATDHGSSETTGAAPSRSPASTATAVRLLPSFGPRAGSLQVRFDF